MQRRALGADMVQMVFVHGVATRSSPAYEVEWRNREKLFKEALFEGKSLTSGSPSWGDLVPKSSSDGKSFAKQGAEFRHLWRRCRRGSPRELGR